METTNAISNAFWNPKSAEQLVCEQRGSKTVERLEEVMAPKGHFFSSELEFEQFLTAIRERRQQLSRA